MHCKAGKLLNALLTGIRYMHLGKHTSVTISSCYSGCVTPSKLFEVVSLAFAESGIITQSHTKSHSHFSRGRYL